MKWYIAMVTWRILAAKPRMMSKVEWSGRTPYSPGPTPRYTCMSHRQNSAPRRILPLQRNTRQE